MPKVSVVDESYNSDHGRAYQKYGVGVEEGAIVIVWPDQCSSMCLFECFLDVFKLTLHRCLTGCVN